MSFAYPNATALFWVSRRNICGGSSTNPTAPLSLNDEVLIKCAAASIEGLSMKFNQTLDAFKMMQRRSRSFPSIAST